MSTILITGEPIIKSKTFLPNPIAKNGIPRYADSRYDKKVIGTAAWKEFWERQIYYCIAGYNTGGVWIPGRYYYYLNFFPISTPGRGVHYPVYVDMDYEFFLLVEKAKMEGYGVICVKARRKGLSFKIISIIDHGMRFNDSEYHAGICGSLEIYAETIYSKFRKAEQIVPPEFRMNKKQSDEGATFTYRIRTEQGMMEAGSFNQILVKTMFANTNVFKGQHLDDCVFEEAGENSALESCYNATKDCFMLGSKMVGTPFVNGCVCAGTKVWDNEGNLVNIENLIQTNGILGFDRESQKVSKEKITYWQEPAEKECYRITTTTGRELECSHDHPILWSNKDYRRGPRNEKIKSTKFVSTDSIKKGDQIAIINEVPFKKYGRKKMWNPRLVGWLIGDGSYGFDNTPRLSTCDHEISDYIFKNFDTSLNKRHITKDGKIYEEIRIKNICSKLRSIGIYGQTKNNKRLPENHHSYRKKDITELLGGLFDTDGCAYSYDLSYGIDLSSSCKEMIKEVQLLLQRLGIHSNISYVKPLDRNRRITDNGHYSLRVLDKDSLINFHKNIHFKIRYKQRILDYIVDRIKDKVSRHADHLSGLRFEKVASIEYIGIKPIYNLTANTTNTYIANGIITHNTAGGMKESREFKKMWDMADAHKLLKFWVPRRKIFFPNYGGAENEKGIVQEDIPYLVDKYPLEYQRVGMQDEKRAEEAFQIQLKELLKGRDRKSFIEFVQNNPGTIKEAFQTFASNHYDTDTLMTAGMRITNKEYSYQPYILEWQTDEKGHMLQPRQVKYRLANTDPTSDDYDQEYNYVYICDDGMPNPAYRKLHTAGLDGYNQDRSDTSDSLGSMCVRRCQPKIGKEDDNSVVGRKPVCIYYQRPPRKEMFFEICLKISYMYGLTGDVLCDAMSDHVIEYFKRNGGERFLAKRPKAFESENSEQTHLYGIKFTGKDTRPRMEGVIQSDILDNAAIWDFPQLIQDCLGYNQDDGEKNDKDLHDAHGMSIMQEIARNINPHKKSDVKENIHSRELNQVYYDADGNIQYRPKMNKDREMDEIDKQIIAMGGMPDPGL